MFYITCDVSKYCHVYTGSNRLHKKEIVLKESFLEDCHIHRKRVFEPRQVYEKDPKEYGGIIYPSMPMATGTGPLWFYLIKKN